MWCQRAHHLDGSINLSLGRTIACRGSFLLGDRVMIDRMPRYFFILAYPDQEIADPRGVIVPSDEAAIEAGRKIIDELLAESGPEDPSPTIITKNEADETIYRYPSN